MPRPQELYTILLVVGAVVALSLGVYAGRRRRAPGLWAGPMLMVGTSLWMFGYAMELWSHTVAAAILWNKVQYAGVTMVPVAWFLYTLQYTGREKYLTRSNIAAIAALPAATVLLASTNELHHLVWIDIQIIARAPVLLLHKTYGWAFWAFAFYAYVLSIVSFFFVAELLVRSHRLYRWQAGTLLVGAIAPWLGSAHDLFRVEPLPDYKLAPFAFLVTNVTMAWSLFRLRLADIVPVARGTIIESMSDAVLVLDEQDRILDTNPMSEAITRLQASKAIGRPAAEVWPEWPELVPEPPDTQPSTREVVLGSGKAMRAYDLRVSPLRDWRGRFLGRVVVVRDITERKRAEEALRVSEERYALAARGANEGLWDIDLNTDRVYFSPRWKAMLGYRESEIGDRLEEWIGRVHPTDAAGTKSALEAHLSGMTPFFENEHRVQHRDGTWRWMLTRGLAVRDEAGKAYRIAGSHADITKRKEAEQRLLHDALHDTLTGLPNRALFMDRLEHAFGWAKRREDHMCAVLFVDLDRFKVINDSIGHIIGDQLLVEVSRRLEKCLRSTDTVARLGSEDLITFARLGGDEFVVLLDDIQGVEDAKLVAERIQEELRMPFQLGATEVFTSASIGIALSAKGYQKPEDLLRDADIAMYRAKTLGRARHEVVDFSSRARALELLDLELGLRRALDHREFELHFQPIVSLDSERIVGFEALVRWKHPERGVILPAEFIPLAEETGLILPLGQWVLDAACRQMSAWNAQKLNGAPLAISVNFSGKQLRQSNLIEQIESTLKETQLDASCLQLEITESVIMEDIDSATGTFRRLKDLGVGLHMDDFGTGYSSLSVLHRFPIDVLKIDRSFISHMEEEGDNEITRTIVMLARNMGKGTIAEGIETVAQLEKLRALDCLHGQGYYFSRPVPASEVPDLMRAAGGKYRAARNN